MRVRPDPLAFHPVLAGLHPPVQATEDGLVLAHDAQATDIEDRTAGDGRHEAWL